MLKLNIYQEGDFFVPHKDTPLSEDSIGSLVIALPVAHRGGHLKVSHRDWKHTFKFDQHIAPTVLPSDIRDENINFTRAELLKRGIYPKVVPSSEPYFRNYRDTKSDEKQLIEITSIQDRYLVQCGIPEPKISYAAFYGDCLHEIEPVTMGMRLTLSYQLNRCSDSAAPDITSHITEDPNMISIPKMVHDPELSELTRLIAAKPHEVDVKTFTEKLSAATLKYLVLASDKYGYSLDNLKVDVFNHLTHMKPPNPSTFSPPPVPVVTPDRALVRIDVLRKALIAALTRVNGSIPC